MRDEHTAAAPGLRAGGRRPDGDPVGDADFIIRGVVDGRPSVARWSRGRLLGDPELIRRVEVVVAMGETFTGRDGSPDVAASLDAGQAAAMLTVMRAFSGVTSIEVAVD